MIRPFDFQKGLTPPRRGGFDPTGFLDLCLIFIFFLILGSRFVVAPGISLKLPQTTGDRLAGAPAFKVLTIGEAQGAEVLFFEGRLLTLEAFATALPPPGERIGESALLVRLDRNVSVETLVRVCDVARQGGFTMIQVAAEPGGAALPAQGFSSP